jgi:hypothetical protein
MHEAGVILVDNFNRQVYGPDKVPTGELSLNSKQKLVSFMFSVGSFVANT